MLKGCASFDNSRMPESLKESVEEDLRFPLLIPGQKFLPVPNEFVDTLPECRGIGGCHGRIIEEPLAFVPQVERSRRLSRLPSLRKVERLMVMPKQVAVTTA